MPMRGLLGVAYCLSLAAGDVSQLHELQKNGRMFELREALEQPGWTDSETLFYRAITESRFGHEAAGIEDLHKFLLAGGSPEMERPAYEELASALLRIGRYGDSARALRDALRLTPQKDADRADTENSRALYESLQDVAPQTIQFAQPVPIEAKHNQLGSWNVPVEVNGRQGEWIFDTGANLSTLSESEAARLGLFTREASAYVKGSTEKKSSLRLTVAPDLRIGNVRVTNVIFLVLSDQALYIAPVKYQIRGILGLPVLRALGSVGISAKGMVRIDTREAGAPGEPNLFWDQLSPIVETRHANHRLEMFLDTGANKSSAYPSLRGALTSDEIGGLKSKRDKTGGAGGILTQRVELIPMLRLEILGRPVDVSNVSLLLKQLAGSRSYRDGVLGMDSLAGGFTLDFRRMQLRLD